MHFLYIIFIVLVLSVLILVRLVIISPAVKLAPVFKIVILIHFLNVFICYVFA